MTPKEKVEKTKTSTKRTPLRMCIYCREMFQQNELIRVVKTKECEITIANDGRINGRSAYCCRKADCINNVIKKHLLDRHFSVSVPESVYEALKKEI